MTPPGPRPATLAAHAGLSPDPQTGALVPPIALSTIYVHGNAADFEYGREHNVTWQRLEEAMTALEGGAGAALFASGMAAVSACLELVAVGAVVVGPSAAYSGTRRLLRDLDTRGRQRTRCVDIADSDAVAAACDGAAVLLLETLTNPLLTVCDLGACCAAAHAAGALVVVDNTFATPLLCRPLEHGADLVVHSLTKFVGGHSDLLLGCAVAATPELCARIVEHRTVSGSVPGQLETWLALRGLRTLDVRVRRQCANAAELAHRLEGHARITAVRYPGLPSHPQHARAVSQLHGGFGAVVGIEISGGAEPADAVCTATRLWQHTTSVGGVESTLERRSRYPLDAEIAAPGLVRLSVGIEDVDDLYDDLAAALEIAASRAP